MSQNMQDLMRQAQSDALTEAPPMRRGVDDVVAAGRRRRRQRRLLRTGGSAAATVLTVAAVAFALPRADARETVAAPASSPAALAAYPAARFATGFKGYRAGAFTVSEPILVTPGYQELYVRRGNETLDLHDGADNRVVASSPSFSALITVYRPGAFQPTRFAKGEPVQVNGRPGLYAADLTYQPGGGAQSRGALAWQYADTGWATIAVVTPDGYSRAELLQIASGLTAAPAAPVKSPVRLTWSPPGYVLTSAGATDDYPGGAAYMVSSLRLTTHPPAYTGLTATVDSAATGAANVRVAVYPAGFVDESHLRTGATAAYCNPGNVNLCYRMTEGGKYQVEIYGSGALSQVDLRKILDGARLADPATPSTWFPITEAAPGALG